MKTTLSSARISTRLGIFVALAAMISVLFVLHPDAQQTADAQGAVPVEVWSIGEDTVWKQRQSCLDNNGYVSTVLCEAPIGSRQAANPSRNVNDGTWNDVVAWGTPPTQNAPGFTYDISTGPYVANHFRREFRLADAGVSNADQIVGVRIDVIYDDTAVIYMNGDEVYRSIRGNLDPTYSTYPINTNIPHDAVIPFGGLEPNNGLVQIPNWNGQNKCEDPDGLVGDCLLSPYAVAGDPTSGNNPPEITREMLDADGDGEVELDELQNISVTVWNQNGSVDMSFDLGLTVMVDSSAVAPRRVQINEVVSKNLGSWPVNLDADPELETPDWIELHNFSNAVSVDVTGWNLSDNSGATYSIPATAPIPPGGYLLIAANDCKPEVGDVCTSPYPHQANFKLSSDGDSLKLTRPDSVVEDEVFIPAAIVDDSWGRPFNSGNFAYIPNTTPGSSNAAAGTSYLPQLRGFSDRLYNVGEPVAEQIDAFDPEGDTPIYVMTNVPGLSTNTSTGAITGTTGGPGSYDATISVTDNDGTVSQEVNWTFLQAAGGGSPLVLNEYNAVREDRQLASGAGPIGNEGDWYEFLVVQDNLDLRGWTIELWDRKFDDGAGNDDLLRQASTLTFTNNAALRALPKGTLIVIREGGPDDININGSTDWLMQFGVDANGNGTYFQSNPTTEIFNSTRSSQMVIIRDASGTLRTPLSGETEAWDTVNGGVNSQEVMNLCTNPVEGQQIDPLAHYRDNGVESTRGAANNCTWTELIDPNNPLAGTVTQTFDQNLSALRSGANFGLPGDVDCNMTLSLLDARRVAQWGIGTGADLGPCLPTTSPGSGAHRDAGDVDGSGTVSLLDARLIAQCAINAANSLCP